MTKTYNAVKVGNKIFISKPNSDRWSNIPSELFNGKELKPTHH